MGVQAKGCLHVRPYRCMRPSGARPGRACRPGRPRRPPSATIQVHAPLRCSARQGMQASAAPLQSHADALCKPLVRWGMLAMTPPHMQPCCVSRPHVSARQGMQASAAPWQSRASNPTTQAVTSGMRAKLQPCRCSQPQLSVRQGMQACGDSLQPHPLCEAAMQTCAASYMLPLRCITHRQVHKGTLSAIVATVLSHRHTGTLSAFAATVPSHRGAQCCQAARQQMLGLPTSGLGALAAGAGAGGWQLSRHLGTRRLSRDVLPDLREPRASVAVAEGSTLAGFRCRG